MVHQSEQAEDITREYVDTEARLETLRAQRDRLEELGYLNDSIDGNFGGNTQTAVKLFQSAVGMEETGIADPATQAALFAEDAPYHPSAQPTPTPTAAPTPTPPAEETSAQTADDGSAQA